MTFFSKHITNAEDMYKNIYNTYRERVFDYIKVRIKNRDDIRDIMQNVFFHLWKYREVLGGTNTENIIFKTCNQEISNFYLMQSKQPMGNDSPILEQPDNSVDHLLHKVEQEEHLIALHESIELLPTSRKQILTMNKLEGITQEKIAVQLNLSPKAVKKQISKAMIFLKKQHNNS